MIGELTILGSGQKQKMMETCHSKSNNTSYEECDPDKVRWCCINLQDFAHQVVVDDDCHKPSYAC